MHGDAIAYSHAAHAQRDMHSGGVSGSPTISRQQSALSAASVAEHACFRGSGEAVGGAAAAQTPMSAAVSLMHKMEGVARLLGGAHVHAAYCTHLNARAAGLDFLEHGANCAMMHQNKWALRQRVWWLKSAPSSCTTRPNRAYNVRRQRDPDLPVAPLPRQLRQQRRAQPRPGRRGRTFSAPAPRPLSPAQRASGRSDAKEAHRMRRPSSRGANRSHWLGMKQASGAERMLHFMGRAAGKLDRLSSGMAAAVCEDDGGSVSSVLEGLPPTPLAGAAGHPAATPGAGERLPLQPLHPKNAGRQSAM